MSFSTCCSSALEAQAAASSPSSSDSPPGGTGLERTSVPPGPISSRSGSPCSQPVGSMPKQSRSRWWGGPTVVTSSPLRPTSPTFSVGLLRKPGAIPRTSSTVPSACSSWVPTIERASLLHTADDPPITPWTGVMWSSPPGDRPMPLAWRSTRRLSHRSGTSRITSAANTAARPATRTVRSRADSPVSSSGDSYRQSIRSAWAARRDLDGFASAIQVDASGSVADEPIKLHPTGNPSQVERAQSLVR